ncbi:hypothetical protein CIL03_05675 [Virgibacillus indicus]|uniref:Uncharacterized protein n=1 Tax=Virgibacillus indicus TaxID=2024554 RepID=A0A265NFQ1_9BACI|nr:CueP family metal-binding protein [Virgibacillus indicus]OZU90627.1 hypothetical protein CIL03_05675 [Virgibacillus indicus]
MKLKIIIAALLLSVFLAACTSEDANEEALTNDSEMTDIKELVQDYSMGDVTGQTASITSKQLIVTENDESSETAYDLPDEEFFVSIAPYINETHPCEIHSLTGCQGELANKDFDVSIEDMEGNLVLEEKMNSESNGFIDLWLPRDKTYRVKITHDGKQVESEISTFENDGTCITTMQLI